MTDLTPWTPPIDPRPVTRDEHALAVSADMSERTLQNITTAAAIRAGWTVYHTHDSRRSQKGFPDLVLAGHGRLLVRELKTRTGRVTPEQALWLALFRAAGVDAGVWRPIDRTVRDEDGFSTIDRELTPERHRS